MKIPTVKGFLYHARDFLDFKNPDHFLWEARGVIHVGANAGFEREDYHRKMLDVIWVEPIPSVYESLAANLTNYPRQRALNALVTDKNGEKYEFFISSGTGVSSSILELADHKTLWPEVEYVNKMEMTGITLPNLLEKNCINLSKYDALVLDTQGSELLVLQGSHNLLKNFKYIKTEAADFEAYKGCCHVDELTSFLAGKGFSEVSRNCFKSHKGKMNYYDLVFKRRDYRPMLPIRALF